MTRRFLALQSLLLWQGGFLFYAAVAIPIGAEVLGSETAQGFITRRVTSWLNGCGAVCLIVLAADSLCTTPGRYRRLVVLGASALILAFISYQHSRLDKFLDVEHHIIIDRTGFYGAHRIYLLLNIVQWITMLIAALQMLSAWRAEDRTA